MCRTDTYQEKEFELTPGRLIHMLSHQLKRLGPVMGEESGLTPIQGHVLKFILLTSAHRDVYQRDVEEEFQIRKPTATGILQQLEKKGLILRESVETDARLKRILPTEQAVGLRSMILENILQMNRRLTKDIPQEELNACMDTLLKMLKNLQAFDQEGRTAKTPKDKIKGED